MSEWYEVDSEPQYVDWYTANLVDNGLLFALILTWPLWLEVAFVAAIWLLTLIESCI